MSSVLAHPASLLMVLCSAPPACLAPAYFLASVLPAAPPEPIRYSVPASAAATLATNAFRKGSAPVAKKGTSSRGAASQNVLYPTIPKGLGASSAIKSA